MGILSNVTSIANDVKDKVSSTVSNATDNISSWLNSTYNNIATAEKITTPSAYLTGDNNVVTTSYNVIPNTASTSSDTTSDNVTKSDTVTATAQSINGVVLSNTPKQYESLADYEQDKAKITTIENIQKLLNSLGYTYGNEGQLKIDGDFGTKTQTNWDNFISDLGVENYLSGIATGVTNLYNNTTGLFYSSSNDNDTTTTLDIKDYAPIISQVSIDTNTSEEEIYSAWDVAKSWKDYEKATYYLTDDKYSEKALDALENAQGVKAEEITFFLGGENYTIGTAMDSSGQEIEYVTKGSTFISDADTKDWLINLVTKVGVELGASTQTVYYNAPIEVVTQGNSETIGFTLGVIGFDVTTINDSDGNKSYTGLSFPNRLGFGFNHTSNTTDLK